MNCWCFYDWYLYTEINELVLWLSHKLDYFTHTSFAAYPSCCFARCTIPTVCEAIAQITWYSRYRGTSRIAVKSSESLEGLYLHIFLAWFFNHLFGSLRVYYPSEGYELLLYNCYKFWGRDTTNLLYCEFQYQYSLAYFICLSLHLYLQTTCNDFGHISGLGCEINFKDL